MMDPTTFKFLKGKKALVTGIANDQSIAWGCAKAFSALGAELAITYRDERPEVRRSHLGTPSRRSTCRWTQRPGGGGALEAIDRSGKARYHAHSIAFAPKEDLQAASWIAQGRHCGDGAVLLVVVGDSPSRS
jgi:enoyl-[acyl-carrier protein] reductase I